MKMSLSGRLPHAAPAGDPYYAYAPQPPLPHRDPQRQGVLTLFVAGLPDDVKPREIHNLFSHRPGFDHCLLEYTGRGNQAVAFVSFFTHEEALSAMAALNGTIFDPETGDRLHIELAKSTSRKPRGGGDVYRVIDKRVNRTGGNDGDENVSNEGGREVWEEEDNVGDGGSDEPSDTENEISSNKDELSSDHSVQRRNKQQNGQSPSKGGPDKSSGDIPPCSTLFIGNLRHACTEENLEEVFSKQPGFQLLKMRRHGGMPVAFADFTDIESSTAALKNLQGTVQPFSDSEGLHIEETQLFDFLGMFTSKNDFLGCVRLLKQQVRKVKDEEKLADRSCWTANTGKLLDCKYGHVITCHPEVMRGILAHVTSHVAFLLRFLFSARVMKGGELE